MLSSTKGKHVRLRSSRSLSFSRTFLVKWKRSATCVACGAPCLAASAYPTFSVSANHIDLWMPLEPDFDRISAAIRQQIDDPVPLQINQNRAVGVASLVGPVVQTHYPHLGHRWG